jgi:hypothetical protein
MTADPKTGSPSCLETMWRLAHHATYWLVVLAIALPILGFVWILLYALSTPGSHLRYLGAAMLASLAAYLAGCLLGFLFGIPRHLDRRIGPPLDGARVR